MSSSNTEIKSRTPWAWVPSLYFAEGLPYIAIMTISTIMYKSLGVSNTRLAFYTSLLYLPWVLKPLWSPFVDIYSSKRRWILSTQFLMAIIFSLVSFFITTDLYFSATICMFWLLAFLSATHDISADAFYLISLNEYQQSWFVGIRNTFYRIAMITGQGGLVMLAGIITMTLGPEQIEVDLSPNKSITIKENSKLQQKVIKLKEFTQLAAENKEAIRSIGLDTNNKTFALFKYPLEHKHLDFFTPKYSISNKIKGLSNEIYINFTTLKKMELVIISIPTTLTLEKLIHINIYPNNLVFSWSVIFLTLAILFLILFNYHSYSLPKPQNSEDIIHPTFKECFISFFKKEKVGIAILFLLTFRLGESQLVKLAQPFMLDSQAKGGLELPLSNVGFIYGTVGTIALILGGIIGGILVAKYGLRKLFFIMALSMNIPNILYWVMAYYQPQDTYLINLFVALEQFGYGFGFTAFTLFMVDFVDDSERFRASHFAIMTGFMALGMMLPMMLSGYIQSIIGYQHFFLWVMLLTIPGFFIIKHIPIKRN